MRFSFEDYRSHKERVISNSFGIWFNLCLLEKEGNAAFFIFSLSLLCFSNNHGLLERFSSLFLECHQTLPLLLKWLLLFGSWFLKRDILELYISQISWLFFANPLFLRESISVKISILFLFLVGATSLLKIQLHCHNSSLVRY